MPTEWTPWHQARITVWDEGDDTTPFYIQIDDLFDGLSDLAAVAERARAFAAWIDDLATQGWTVDSEGIIEGESIWVQWSGHPDERPPWKTLP